MSKTFLNYTFRKILELSDLEINVLQVAIDHMVEHLEEAISGDDATWITRELEAAKRLKKLFSQGEV